MTLHVDPEGVETSALFQAATWDERDVLEIGCGDGRLTFRYAAHTRSVLAIDPDEEGIEFARATLPEELRGRVTFECAGIEELPITPESFDVVLLAWSL